MTNNSINHVLVIHIGTLKTGTTSLQNFLFNNRDALKNEGWAYPTFSEVKDVSLKKNGKLLLLSYLQKNDDLFDKCMQHILKYLRNFNVIISSEDFWFLNDIETFFSKVIKYYGNIKILAYIRRQDQYLESLYNQFIKSVTNETRNLESFIEYAEKNKLANYLDKLMKLESIFDNNLIVRRYEKGTFQGIRKDIISDFLSIFRIDENNDWIFPENTSLQNMALGSRILEIKRIFNKVYNSYNFYAPFTDFIRKFNDINIMNGEKDFYKIMPPDLRSKILNNHKEENIAIGKRYFQIQGGGIC